jgi:protein-tyrosine-phosphatase
LRDDDAPLRTVLRASELVFVCSGNMVRSAFAELYGRHLGCPLPLRSAATTYRNDRIFPETARALLARGVARSAVRAFRPTHIEDLAPAPTGAAVRLGMTRSHLAALRACGLRAPAYLLGAVAGGEGEIPDPVLEGADFEETFARVEACVEAIVGLLSE